jgi:hypothetical protein
VVLFGRMPVLSFAGTKYLETHRLPRGLDEMCRQRLVMQATDETAARKTFQRVYPCYEQRDLVVMRANISSTDYWAVANGAGIAVLLTYARSRQANDTAARRSTQVIRLLADEALNLREIPVA